ncbi:NAD(P)-binding protein [Exiguobacterium sp. SL14]|nr:NAD(P)-binding protein [Exiguobacterium sp. SL14]MCY1692019.1 NAD(P)-binding protein [Exiguobacterium sp. SL14]
MKHIAVIGARSRWAQSRHFISKTKGFRVTVIERNTHIGGKMMPIVTEGHRFDFGPNTITMLGSLSVGHPRIWRGSR